MDVIFSCSIDEEEQAGIESQSSANFTFNYKIKE